MGIVLVLVAVLLFALADYLIRNYMRKSKENKLKKEREEILTKDLEIDFSFESASLKRVEVDNPAAKILAVDDEEVILNSFRKILVVNGYSVDTVQTGQEALGLIQKNSYDFVFTDLKMPEMSGVDVCKGVKHLRPDVDVIIITGYASIETAVETLKFGAMDYVQKPFTEDELLTMVKKFVLRRQENLDRLNKANVEIIHEPQISSADNMDFSIPGGVFIAPNHCWVFLNLDGSVYVGIDDFANRFIGPAESVEFPALGEEIEKYQRMFSISGAGNSFIFDSPVTGKVTAINTLLADDLKRMAGAPYFENWLCKIESDKIDECLTHFKIGQQAIKQFEDDIEKLQDFRNSLESKDTQKMSESESKEANNTFFKL